MSEGLNNFFSFRFHIKLSYTSNDGKAGSSEAGVFITVPRGALNKRPSWASVPSPSGQGCPSTVQKVMGREAWASLCGNREAQPWMRTAGGGGGPWRVICVLSCHGRHICLSCGSTNSH